jgi:hypothetical protein
MALTPIMFIRHAEKPPEGEDGITTEATGCGFLKAVEFGCRPPWSWAFCCRQRIGYGPVF